MARTIDDLRQLQALPLSLKIRLTQDRIRQWINEMPGVYVSFSGGKDSTVLLDIARQIDPDIPAVFFDTMEYPEMKEFVRTFENVEIIKPKMNYRQVVEKYGYPIISKEVSECVYGARRYLTKVAEQANLDRQTDRQTRRMHSSTENSEALENTVRTRISQTPWNWRVSADAESMLHRTGGGTTENTTESVDLESLVKGNLRVARLMGALGKGNERTVNIPDKDRSAFSCARYQFFLDAPFQISNQCCNVMKKHPAHAYTKKTGRYPITAEMAVESRLRTQKWLKSGCNGFDLKMPKSMPMAFWTEQDVLQYIYRNDLPICEIYGDVVVDYETAGQLEGQMSMFPDTMPLKTTGAKRTGCMGCLFGIHLEKTPNRLEQMKDTHPKVYEWLMKPWDDGGMGYKDVIDWINENGNMNIKY